MTTQKRVIKKVNLLTTNEQELIKQARRGNILAFEQLLSLYEGKIFNYLYRLLGARHDAEDATQEVFIKVYKNLHSFKIDKQFSPWLYKIATNTAYDLLRKKQADKEVPFLYREGDPPETILNHNPYKNMERMLDLEVSLRQLKPIYRTVLILYYRDDLTYETIAEILEVPLNTVKTYIKRAKENLSRIMHQN